MFGLEDTESCIVLFLFFWASATVVAVVVDIVVVVVLVVVVLVVAMVVIADVCRRRPARPTITCPLTTAGPKSPLHGSIFGELRAGRDSTGCKHPIYCPSLPKAGVILKWAPFPSRMPYIFPVRLSLSPTSRCIISRQKNGASPSPLRPVDPDIPNQQGRHCASAEWRGCPVHPAMRVIARRCAVLSCRALALFFAILSAAKRRAIRPTSPLNFWPRCFVRLAGFQPIRRDRHPRALRRAHLRVAFPVHPQQHRPHKW